MNSASLVKHYLSVIENTTSQIDSLKTFEPSYLVAQFNALQKSFLQLSKLTNNGKGPSELRVEKIKALKKWMTAYADKEAFLQSTVPQRYKNKTVAIDSSTLDTYQGYANIAITYMAELPVKYEAIKERALPILGMRTQLIKNVGSFELEDSDLLALAAKKPVEDVVEGIVHTPQKTINTIRGILRAYGRFIKTAEAAQEEIMPLLDFFEDMTLEQIYEQLNNRNRLLKSLVKNLSNVKKIIEKENFQHKFAIMNEYQKLLENMTAYLPGEIIQKLSVTVLTSPVQDQLDKSPQNVKRYDPLKDPSMNWPEPKDTQEEEKDEKKEDMKDRIDRVLRHHELADLSQRPGKALSPDEKKKYEALWRAEASEAIKKLIRLANYLEIKYQS